MIQMKLCMNICFFLNLSIKVSYYFFFRYRTTGSVKPKDAKEGRTESPLVTAIRDYRMRLGMSRQAEIREQLIADGICSRENAPSRSSINQ